MMFLLLIAIAVVVIAIVSLSGKKKSNEIEVSVPHPEKCRDETMIDYISITSKDELIQVFNKYDQSKLYVKPLYRRVFLEKLEKGYIIRQDFLKDADEVEQISDEPKSIKNKRSYNRKSIDDIRNDLDYSLLKTKRISSPYLTPRKDLEDTSHYLFGKKVVITGEFEKFEDREIMAKMLWEVGADVDMAISKKTEVVVLGKNPGWKKLELIDEFQPQVIDEEIFIEMFPNFNNY